MRMMRFNFARPLAIGSFVTIAFFVSVTGALVVACLYWGQGVLIPVALGTPIFMMLVRWGAGRRRTA